MRKNRGFTLVELIIVIAILAVLVAVLAPQLFIYVEKSRKAVCSANVATVTRSAVMAYNGGLERDYNAALEKAFNDYSAQLVCPSGGVYELKKPAGGEWYISCSKHGDIGSLGESETMQTVTDVMKENSNKRVDSGAIGFNGGSDAVVAALKEKGLDLTALGAVSWYYSKGDGATSTRLYWSSQDINSMNAGDKLYVMCYNPSSGNYTLYDAKVDTRTEKIADTTQTYNVLTPAGNPLNKGEKDQSYETVYALYQSKLNEGKT